MQAAVSGPVERCFQLKQRVCEWGVQVCGWLLAVHAAALRAPAGVDALRAVAAGGDARLLALTAALARCLTAWVKCACLHHVDPGQGRYLVEASAALMFLPAGRHEDLVGVGVDAFTEVLVFAPEGMRDALAQLALRLPAAVEARVAGGVAAGQLPHALAAFCSANAALAAADEGLRRGLLRLLALPLQPEDTVMAPTLAAVTDVLEAAHLHSGGNAQILQYLGLAGSSGGAPIDDDALNRFVDSLLEVLLGALQAGDAAMQGSLWADPGAEGPEALRPEADLAVQQCAAHLGAGALMHRLQAFVQAAAAAHGVPSLAAAKAVDVRACSPFFIFGASSHAATSR